FPETDVHGCFFHLKKSLWILVQEAGLAVQYYDIENKDNLVRLYVKMMASLAFVQVDDVINDFRIVLVLWGKGELPRFHMSLWNFCDLTVQGLPHTNNNLEGWHNALQSSIKSHHNLVSLIDCLKLEQTNKDNIYIEFSALLTGVNKAKEEKLDNAIADYNSVNIESFLKYLSFVFVKNLIV
ncbi:unnamed protein product, partial [Brachionus calyciflorus]